MRTLVLWNEVSSIRDVSLTFLEILLLNLKILPIVPEECQLLFASEMVKKEEVSCVGWTLSILSSYPCCVGVTCCGASVITC